MALWCALVYSGRSTTTLWTQTEARTSRVVWVWLYISTQLPMNKYAPRTTEVSRHAAPDKHVNTNTPPV
eukprot:scaffold10374_cov121-Isochrysis_galbana.AAC.3